MQAPPSEVTTLPPQRRQPAPSPEGRPAIPWWTWVLTGGLFCCYLALSLRIHQRLLSHSYDLGIFEQVVRSYAQGRLPVSELKAPDFPVLGDHFSPVLALLAPVYRLWPSVDVLLGAQAALIAVSVLPLTGWARRTLGTPAAVVTGVCYGLSWGIASAVGFDFHEVAFAVPLLAWSLAALGEGRLRAAACWALPLLLVKEDLGITVAVIGVLIALRGGRDGASGASGRVLGIATAVTGVAGAALAAFVIVPAFNPSGGYAYLSYLDGPGGGSGAEGATGFWGLLLRMTVGLVTPETKVVTVVLMLAPTLFLAVRSPLVWVAVPTLVWRFVSGNAFNWGTGFHYSLVLMPVVFAAFLDALNRRGAPAASVRRYLIGSAAVTLMLLPAFPLWQLVQPSTWRSDPRIAVAHRLMDRIPDGATVQASDALVPQLTGRTSVSLFGFPASRPDPQWIIVDTAVAQERRWPLNFMEESIALGRARGEGYRTEAQQDGFVLLSRTGG